METTDADVEQKALKVAESRRLRNDLEAKFGFVPLSVLRLSRGSLSKQTFHFSKELAKSTGRGKRAEKKGGVFYTDKALRISGGGSRTSDGRALSVMPPELVDFFIKYYAKPGDVYLDPFAGQGVRMQVAAARGLHYIATDLSREFVEYCWSVQRKLGNVNHEIYDGIIADEALARDAAKVASYVTLCDARNVDWLRNDIGDFGFTSPPYWDIEYYGDDPNQLGTGKSYADFIMGIEHVAGAWLPKFKSGATFVVNINDFRKDEKFYMYHADLASAFKRAGWVLDDIWIIEGLVGGLPKIFAASSNMKKRAPKVHEYGLVFKKP